MHPVMRMMNNGSVYSWTNYDSMVDFITVCMWHPCCFYHHHTDVPWQKDLSDIGSLVSLPTILLHNNGRLHERLKVQCKCPVLRVSQSWWRINKLLLSSLCACEGLFGMSFKPMRYVDGIVGRHSRQLCHLGPFVVVRQSKTWCSFNTVISQHVPVDFATMQKTTSKLHN